MNPQQGHGSQQIIPQGHFDILMSAIAASGQQIQQQHHKQQYVQNGQNQAGMGTPMNSLLQNTPTGPAKDTAISLDQMFGHSGFSRAISLAQSTPPNQLNTPLYEILLQNLLQQQQQQHQNPLQPDSATAHIQQTRSGRISRPPVPPPMAQAEVMRALQLLSQPGMEPVRAALESAGLFQGINQSQSEMGEVEKRDQAISQAMQMLAAAQDESNGQAQGYANAQVAPTNTYGLKNDQTQNEPDSLSKGKKRPRKQDSQPPIPQQNNHVHREQPVSYSPDTWPAPPRGKGSRSAMSKEEIASRRKERNKASALASRMKKANEVEDVKDALARKEAEAEVLARRCERLERELETLRQLVLSHGLSLPTPAPYSQGTTPSADHHIDPALYEEQATGQHKSTPHDLYLQPQPIDGNSMTSSVAVNPTQTPNPYPFNFAFPTSFPTPLPEFSSSTSATLAPDINTQTDPVQTQFTFNPFPDPFTFANTGNTMDTGAEPLLDFNMFMNMDNMLDDEADGDFEPETSPHQGSDTDADPDGDDLEDSTPKGKRTSKDDDLIDPDLEADIDTPVYGEEGEMGDEDFIDPEMEDEDLFLPIEDVPIPPDAFQSNSTGIGHGNGHGSGGTNGDVTAAMMKALKVDTRDQLAAVMQKLVDSAGEGGVGVGDEILGKLRNVIMMAQNQAGQG